MSLSLRGMTHLLFLLAIPPGLMLAIVLVVTATNGAGRSPVYSVPEVQAGLAREPHAWLGRAVRVRGVAVLTSCPADGVSTLILCLPTRVFLDDPSSGAEGDPLPVILAKTDPLHSLLRRVPLLGALAPAPQPIQWDMVATYRVRFRSVANRSRTTACAEAVVLDAEP